MEKNRKINLYPVVAALILILIYQQGCFRKKESGEILQIGGKKYEIIKKEIDTIYQIKSQVLYKEGKTIFQEVEVVKEIPADVDTASILRDYYSKVFYKDTFRLEDKLGFIAIDDTISQNRIYGRKFSSVISIPTVKETTYLKEISNIWFAGPSVQLGQISSLGGDLHLKTKKDMLFGIGIGVNSNISPYFRGSMSWKIK
jgi:hypothetical protein